VTEERRSSWPLSVAHALRRPSSLPRRVGWPLEEIIGQRDVARCAADRFQSLSHERGRDNVSQRRYRWNTYYQCHCRRLLSRTRVDRSRDDVVEQSQMTSYVLLRVHLPVRDDMTTSRQRRRVSRIDSRTSPTRSYFHLLRRSPMSDRYKLAEQRPANHSAASRRRSRPPCMNIHQGE